MDTIEEMYTYLEGPFYDSLYTADSFDGDEEYTSLENNAGNQRGNVLGHNVIVGAVRIGQLRVQFAECNTPVQLRFTSTVEQFRCVKQFKKSRESLEPFGVNQIFTPGLLKLDGIVEDYDPSKEPSFKSTTSVKYTGPRFSILLPNRENCTTLHTNETICLAKSIIQSLQDNKFADLQTSVIFVDSLIYNPNLDRFLQVNISSLFFFLSIYLLLFVCGTFAISP